MRIPPRQVQVVWLLITPAPKPAAVVTIAL